MNPYDIDFKKLKDSQEISEPKDLLKLELAAEFLKVTSKMSSEEIIQATGLHKSDLSRIRALNLSRFTIDRILGYLDSVGYVAKVKVKKKNVS